MNPYAPHLECAEEFLSDSGGPYDNLFEAAMFNYLTQDERQHLAEWAVRRGISPDDPIWCQLELATLGRRWNRETMEDVHREFDLQQLRLSDEVKAQQQRMQSEGEAFLRQMRYALEATAKNATAQLPGQIRTSVESTIRDLIRERLGRLRLQTILLLVGIAILLPAAGFLAGRYVPPSLTAAQTRQMESGHQLESRYPTLGDAERAQLHRLMGWEAPK